MARHLRPADLPPPQQDVVLRSSAHPRRRGGAPEAGARLASGRSAASRTRAPPQFDVDEGEPGLKKLADHFRTVEEDQHKDEFVWLLSKAGEIE